MNKQARFVTLLGLLLMGGAATFAQSNSMNDIPNELRHERATTIYTYTGWRLQVDAAAAVTAQWGNNYAYLDLKSNALVSSRSTMILSSGPGDDNVGPQLSGVWSIPLSGSAKEVVFTADGNLVVYDTANKVLWQSNTAGRGHRFTFYSDGVLDIFDKENRSVWRR